MRITITALLAGCLLGLSAVAAASDRLPDRGMTQDSVRKQFGTPKRQVAPVGTPPISRWIYDGFTVYFEGNVSIHAVSHGRTLTTPPVTSSAPLSAPAASAPVNLVEELPQIDELAPGQTPASAVPPASPEPAGPTENTFRFDPVTGRIIEFGPDGKPIQSPTAQPAPARTPDAPQPVESKRAPAVVAPAQAAPSGGASMRFDPASGRMVEVGPDGKPVAPAPTPSPEPAPAPAPAAVAPAPAAPAEDAAPAAGRFRFDPASGRIVMDEPAPASSEPDPAAESTPAPAATPAPAPAPAPAPEKPPEQPASGGSGFSIQW
ncbi:MAG: hypothetical protein ACK4SX_04475 [Alcanivoracaceae bacterium]